MSRALLVLLVAVSACGPAARGPTPATPAARRPATPAPAAPAVSVPAYAPPGSHPLEQRAAGIARRLGELGASEPLAVGRGFLANQEAAVHDVVIPGGSCMTVTALVSDGIRDLDAQLYSPSGELLAADTAEDAHPTLQVCARADAPRQLALRVVNFDGHGAYHLSAFASSEDVLPAIAHEIGGRPGRVYERAADATAARVTERMDAAVRRGFTALAEPREVPLTPSQSVWVPIAMRPGQCLLALAVPEAGLEHVSIRLLDGDGTELARSADTEPEAALQFCGSRERELVLVVSARRGGGSARVFTWTAPTARLGGSNSLWFGQTATRRADAASSGTPPADCATLARPALARADAAGFRTTVAHRCVSLARGEAAHASIALEADTCARVEVTAGHGIARPAVTLGFDGAPIAEHVGSGLGAPAIAHACSATSKTLDATLVARSGSGLLGLLVTTRRVSDSDLEAEAQRLDAHARATAAGGHAAVEDGAICAGSSVRTVDVAPGTCTRVTFVAGGAAPVSLCARRGDVSVACDAGSSPEVAHCAPPDELHRLDVHCTPRQGESARGHWIIATRRPTL